MRVTICGSIAFYDNMLDVKKKLEKLGHVVKLPPGLILDKEGNEISVKEYYKIRKGSVDSDLWVWDRKENYIRLHMDKVEWSDVILVLNYDKNNIKNYIGGNTLIEMGVAFYLKKKIYMFNSIPEISYKEEILGMKPIIINGDLSKIK